MAGCLAGGGDTQAVTAVTMPDGLVPNVPPPVSGTPTSTAGPGDLSHVLLCFEQVLMTL